MVDGGWGWEDEEEEEEEDGFVVFGIRDKGKNSEEFLFSLFFKKK